jgi:general secretion pathway protein D
MVTLVYDVTDLLGQPADFYTQTGGTATVSGGEGQAGTEQLGEQEQMTRDQLITDATTRITSLVQLIQQAIEPLSWVEAGGEGSIMVYQNKKLVIYQTREVQEGIGNFLDKLRNALGHQVAIEARFLLVGENFLEDVGLDMDFRANVGGNVGLLDFQQDSSTISVPTETGITGSLVPPTTGPLAGIAAMTATGGYGNLILNDLEVSIILRATQAHRDAKSLTAPKVTVLNGERATFQIQRMRRYPYDITIDIEQIGTAVGGAIPAYMWTVDTTEGYILTGTLLNVTPIITPDKKNVLLNIETQLTDFLGWQTYDIQLPVIGATAAGGTYSLQYPETEISKVQTRVSVPDKATLLLGGQRITAEAEREAGVPVLSKVPFLGRLFSNRSKVKDSQILLILVKPTIILRDEAENKAIATMESSL